MKSSFFIESSTRKNNFSPNKKVKLMSFSEMKEHQRKQEQSHMAPGAYNHEKKFGEEVHHKMQFGGKYKFKPDSNPPPGLYNPEAADRQTKPKSYNTTIKTGFKRELKPKDKTPDPGAF